MYLILFQIGEVETVRDVELARCCVNRIEADISDARISLLPLPDADHGRG